MSETVTTAAALSAEDKAAVGGLAARLTEAWAAQSGEKFAALFTEDATTLLPGDVFLQGRTEIGSHMAAGYAGPYKGTGVVGKPLSIRAIDEHTAVMVTEGGVTLPGEDWPTEAMLIRATWVAVKQNGGEWLVSAYQNSPVNLPSS
ncbi:SgcJ/EcaC family oxidoreductase [Streptomyces sp. NPDC047002]|uniref:SgcJ/EcaC family oxidoreductase n=1 Tax=Streptomyces sp. NPDC047002 TaxID=3155475 RepID=UPI0034556645